MAKSTQKKEEICVYLGPSIVGLIQMGTIYPCSKAEALKTVLAEAVAKYPDIAGLVVSGDSLPEARVKIKQTGTLLNERYKRFSGSRK